MTDFLLEDGPIIMAHRGGGGEAPENTLEAYSHAAALGYRYMETDVYLGTDRKVYLHHGAFMSFRQGLLVPQPSHTTLADLFEALPDKCYSIDPKHERVVVPLARLLVEYRMIDKVCLVSSKDDTRCGRVADEVERLSGKRPVTVLSSIPVTIDLLRNSSRLHIRKRQIQAAIIYTHKKVVTPRTVRIAHEEGLKMIAWTVNKPATMRKFLAWGVDGFMTDYPSRAKEFIGEA